jgi:2-polyprenyl-3-methyl-5-hydroxy-6-metoxy-1,4-benzoquinol methylase
MPSRDEALIADPAASWDAAAAAWDEFVETGLDFWRTEVHGPALLAACGDVDDQRVLDLGCGQGWFSRQLARHGARVVGVDFSAAQLANARRHEAAHPLGIAYRQLDAALIGEQWPPKSFDLVTACMALHDSPDTGGILAAARQVLMPAGCIVFSIVHPVAAAPVHEWVCDDEGQKQGLRIDRYFDSGPYVIEWNMARLTTHWARPQWHRTLTEWSTLITEAGFAITQLEEPRPTPEQAASNPKMIPATRIPYFLIVVLQSTA